jgi:hypothetical protein
VNTITNTHSTDYELVCITKLVDAAIHAATTRDQREIARSAAVHIRDILATALPFWTRVHAESALCAVRAVTRKPTPSKVQRAASLNSARDYLALARDELRRASFSDARDK